MTFGELGVWAILGTGQVSEKMARAVKERGGRVAFVSSRRAERAEAFALRHGATSVGFEAAATDPGVQVVYIATPPSEHERHALLAISAGKAVLVEKPFALDRAGASRIADAARAAGVFCSEAMWTRFQPLTIRIHAQIAAGAIGDVRQFDGSFCGASVPDAGESLFDPARGGGALMHRGVYPLSLARHLLGPVQELRAMARYGATGVDEDCALTLRHESGALSTVRASLSSNGSNMMVIQGSKGTIRASGPIYRPPGARLFRTSPRGKAERTADTGAGLRDMAVVHALWQRVRPIAQSFHPGGRRLAAPYSGAGYGHQVDAVMAAVAAGETVSKEMPLHESVEIMGLIDSARSQWGAR